MSEETEPSTVDAVLRLEGDLAPADRPVIVDRFGKLDTRLRSFSSEKIELQLTMKERDTPSQRTTLEVWIVGQPRLVSTSHETGFDQAINEVRDDMIRLLSDAKNRSEPRNNRHLRDSGRG
ncbi:MAG: HPF/RaiA family ribosome-associated protein [Acidimicrobiales bacterium]